MQAITSRHRNWKISGSGGPVVATAVHAGHDIRDELLPYLAVDHGAQRREEDPMTDHLANVGDHVFCCYNSRFEVDLNRPEERAFATSPEETWGLRVWRESPPQSVIERSLDQHRKFYQMMARWLEELILAHGNVLVLDVHSYNHRREGAGSAPAPEAGNPDIDLGATTLDHAKFGNVLERFQSELQLNPIEHRHLDVRTNVRYPDGGFWPEWVFDQYGENICTITLEYKKIYMDEWSGDVHLSLLDALYNGLEAAKNVAAAEMQQCR